MAYTTEVFPKSTAKVLKKYKIKDKKLLFLTSNVQITDF